MVQWLQALATLAEDQGSGPLNPYGNSQSLLLRFEGIQHPLLASLDSVHTWCIYVCKEKTQGHKTKIKASQIFL